MKSKFHNLYKISIYFLMFNAIVALIIYKSKKMKELA